VPHLPSPALAPFDAIIQRATQKDPAQRFADARAMRDALASVAAPVASAGGKPRSAFASSASRPRPRRSPAAGASGVMRVGAVLVSCVALVAILIAGSVIYLVESPGGKERRALLQRVLSTASDTASAPR
jgi:hypothetical protein